MVWAETKEEEAGCVLSGCCRERIPGKSRGAERAGKIA